MESNHPDQAKYNKVENEPFRFQEEIQFSDGRIALGFRTPGDRIEWAKHKYTQFLDMPSVPTLAILGTENGRRFAIGGGVIVMLPEFSKETGKFKSDTKKLAAKSIKGDLPDLILGEPWELLGDDDRVSDVVLDYKTTTPGARGMYQLDMPNPFDHAREIVRDVAEKMDAAGQLQLN